MLTTLAVGAAASAWPYSCDASLTVRNVTTFFSLSDVTVVVTGATGRSGLQIALAASLANATVILADRNATELGAAEATIKASVPAARLDSYVFDLDSLNATASAAVAIMAKHPKVDVLVNNAGCIDGEITGDGYVGTFQVNAIAPALLAELLLPALQRAPAPRAVYVSSASAFDGVVPKAWPPRNKRSAANMLAYARGQPAVGEGAAYGMSKLVLVWYVSELHRRRYQTDWGKKDVAHISVNPGFFRVPPFTPEQKAMCTTSMRFSPCPQLPEQGAASTALAALAPGAEAAAGGLLDFETDVDSAEGRWVQHGQTCVPRPLPAWDAGEAAKWYDAVQEVILPFVD